MMPSMPHRAAKAARSSRSTYDGCIWQTASAIDPGLYRCQRLGLVACQQVTGGSPELGSVADTVAVTIRSFLRFTDIRLARYGGRPDAGGGDPRTPGGLDQQQAAAVLGVLAGLRVGGCGLASQMKTTICARSETSHIRMAACSIARDARTALVASLLTSSSVFSENAVRPHSHSIWWACSRVHGTSPGIHSLLHDVALECPARAFATHLASVVLVVVAAQKTSPCGPATNATPCASTAGS